MIIYVDFDGVLVDTWPVIEGIYNDMYNSNMIEEAKLRKMFQQANWDEILFQSKKNIENINIIKNNKEYEIKILTKINSESEKYSKINFLKESNINLEIITLNIDESKSTIVDPVGNILIDDELKNIEEWDKKGGIGILYSKNNDGKDSDGRINTEYEMISTFKDVFNNKDIDK